MTINEKYPVLYGYTGDNERTELHGINEVAKYICKNGLYGDLIITKESNELLISTFGVFLDKVYDMEYRDELLKVMIPMQHEVERTYLSDETDEDRVEREVNEYLESEEYEIDAAIEIREYQEESKGTPSRELIEKILTERRREQIEKEIECEKEGHRWKETDADPENGRSDMECKNCGMTGHIQWM